MKVQIFVYYLGKSLYQIVTIVKDGSTAQTRFYVVNHDKVTSIRNRMCEQWTQRAYEVEASAIPEPWDLGGTR